MDFHRITTLQEPWDIHSYGIKEPPKHYPVIDPFSWEKGIVLSVTPGLAFDRKGGRLGRGGGYYDRFFNRCQENLLTLGVCFACQMVDQVPIESHDCPIGGVVTEEGIVPCADRQL
jgi:5-formyltetrahydrofolate cyclo-ligase